MPFWIISNVNEMKIKAILVSPSRGPYHIETNSSICKANQWTGFYMIRTSVMKKLKVVSATFLLVFSKGELL